jgi:hypothetical protein
MKVRSLALLFSLAACGDAAPRAAGEPCVGTAECAAGLVCDFGQSPAICAGSGSGGPAIDAAADGIDAAMGGPADADVADVVDAAAPPVDAAAPPADAAVDAML